MIKWVASLLDLQNLDMKLRKLNNELAKIPGEVQRVQEGVVREQEALKEAEQTVKEIEKDIKLAESEIDQIQAQINKLQNQSIMIKKNEEYRALMHEIETHKNKIGDHETRQIHLMDKLEEVKDRRAERKKDLEKARRLAHDRAEELEDLKQAYQAEAEKLKGNRGYFLEKVTNTAALDLYTRLLEAEGSPLVAIHNDNCGHCHLKLTPQTYHDCQKGQLTTCETCGRLLYSLDIG